VDLELVTIGSELLLGFTVDTNGAVLGRALAELGVRVTRRTAVADDPAAIGAVVREALARTGAVLTTGGLGPTRDDLTRRAVAAVFGTEVRFDAAVWREIEARFRRLGREPSPTNRSQAEVPAGAVVLPNRWGSAPGLWLEGPPGLAILLPGVPREMRELLRHEVLPRLAARAGGGVVRSLVVRTTAVPESVVAERLAPLEEALAPLTLAYLPGPHGVDLRLTAWNLPPGEAPERLDAAARRLETALEGFAYARGDVDLAEVVLDLMRKRGLRLAVAESCTGGLLGGRITAIPGSSEVFLGGLVCYDNRMKVELAGVPPELLERHGAVSPEVALALARGARERLGADTAIGVTGIAGPSGGTPEKPVGTVCLGWVAGPNEHSTRATLPGDRAEIRERATQLGLYRLWRMIHGSVP
jgi:nicotinamide-nucleotide amidase